MNYCTCASLPIEGFREICKLFPDMYTKLKKKRETYKDKWKTFMFNIIYTIHYFKNLSVDSLEEIFYSLETDYYEKDTVLVEAGDSLDKIWIIVDGEIDINVHMDTGEVVIIETLTRGCHFGQFSCMIEAPQMFQYKTKTNVTIQSINAAMLEQLRIELADLDDELASGEIHEYGVPVCDFKVNRIEDFAIMNKIREEEAKQKAAMDKSMNKSMIMNKSMNVNRSMNASFAESPKQRLFYSSKQKLQDCVRRAYVLNLYKKKKTTRLTQLIIDLKKKAMDEEEEERREQKRERYKKDLSEIVLDLLEGHLIEPKKPNLSSKYMELKMDNYVTILEDQNNILNHFNKKIKSFLESVKMNRELEEL